MTLDIPALLADLPHSNDVQYLPSLWRDYYKLYSFDDILKESLIDVSVLQQGHQITVVQSFKRLAGSRGTAVLVHGYMDHSGLYRHLILYLLKAGWDVIIYDKQGHGLSSGERYAIESFQQYAQQLKYVMENMQNAQDRPIILLGQSTGGAVVMEYRLTCEPPQHLQALILLAPLIRPTHFGRILWMYRVLRPFVKRFRRGFSKNSHDQNFLRFVRYQDPISREYLSVPWVGAMIDWQQHVSAQPSLNIPLHVIQGTGDDTVNWRYNLQRIKQVFLKSDIYLIEQAKHHLVNESTHYRQQVFDIIARILS